MSWIVESEDHSMIQDQHRSEDTTFMQGKLYGPLHKAGHALSFAMNVSYSQIVSHGRHMKIKVNGWSRTKTRIVLPTSVAFLHQCENLVKFSWVAYDVLESHRHAVNQELLHRDLSQTTILTNARHGSGQMKKLNDGKDRPRYCREVLDKIGHAEPDALVIDFDNACRDIDGEQRTHNPLQERTGTPKYIARSTSLGQILYKNHAFESMPELPHEVYERYAEVYDTVDPLRTFKDAEGNTHGGKLDHVTFKRYKKTRDVLKTEFQHCPRHDAESVFWCILAFLMRSLPAYGAKPEDDLNKPAFIKQWKKFEIHEIPEKDDNTDSRISLLEDLDWSKVVHHKLALVSDLITELVEQVYPEYALLRPPPHKFHLHEAMQRILLKYAVQWKDQNVDFNTEEQRKILISENMSTARPAPDG